MHANCIWLVSASQLRKCQTSFFAASLLFFVERSSAGNWDFVDFFYYPIVFPLHPPGVQTVRDAVEGLHTRTLARCTLIFTVGLESTRTTRGQSRMHVGSGCKEVQRQSAYTSQNKPLCLSFSNIIPENRFGKYNTMKMQAALRGHRHTAQSFDQVMCLGFFCL